jgi:uroporphyrinogen decarboxylase
MNRVQRVRAAVAGEAVDRPPFTLWYHFGLQHAPAERTAQAHLEFRAAYDLDWLKLMNDYAYPMPAGVETVRTAEDLARLEPLDLARSPLGEQLRVVEQVVGALRGEALVVDTVFNAWNTLRRNVVKDAMGALMREAPEELEAALAVVNDGLVRYAQASLDRGAAGIFLSVPAAEEMVTPAEYERFMRPYDLTLLHALRGRGELHVLHAHGARLHFDRLLDYPVHAISWADREGGPTLAEARKRTPRALMGGLAHTGFAYASAARIRGELREAVATAGPRGLFLAPGCAVETYTFPELIRAARDEAGRAGGA